MKKVKYGSYPQSVAAEEVSVQLQNLIRENDGSTDYVIDRKKYRFVLAEEELWFVYEPILWDVIEENEERMTLVSSKILDAAAFNPDIFEKYEPDDGHYYYVSQTSCEANKYSGSDLERWLNGTFLDRAFAKEEQERICEKKILLPSYEQLTEMSALDREATAFAAAKKDVDAYWCREARDEYRFTPCYAGLWVQTSKQWEDANKVYGVVPQITVFKK